jgi:hypothetical protein
MTAIHLDTLLRWSDAGFVNQLHLVAVIDDVIKSPEK